MDYFAHKWSDGWERTRTAHCVRDGRDGGAWSSHDFGNDHRHKLLPARRLQGWRVITLPFSRKFELATIRPLMALIRQQRVDVNTHSGKPRTRGGRPCSDGRCPPRRGSSSADEPTNAGDGLHLWHGFGCIRRGPCGLIPQRHWARYSIRHRSLLLRRKARNCSRSARGNAIPTEAITQHPRALQGV